MAFPSQSSALWMASASATAEPTCRRQTNAVGDLQAGVLTALLYQTDEIAGEAFFLQIGVHACRGGPNRSQRRTLRRPDLPVSPRGVRTPPAAVRGRRWRRHRSRSVQSPERWAAITSFILAPIRLPICGLTLISRSPTSPDANTTSFTLTSSAIRSRYGSIRR